MRRIWKKPNTVAGKKALAKSASRMARDILRLNSRKKMVQAASNYYKNKEITQQERLILNNLIEKALARRHGIAKQAVEEFEIVRTPAYAGEFCKSTYADSTVIYK